MLFAYLDVQKRSLRMGPARLMRRKFEDNTRFDSLTIIESLLDPDVLNFDGEFDRAVCEAAAELEFMSEMQFVDDLAAF